MKQRIKWLAILLVLSTSGLTAQTWSGSQAVSVEVKDSKGKAVSEARVVFTFLGIPGEMGPDVVATDSKGRAVLTNLAPGPWQVEVSHPDYLSFIAMLEVRRGKKPLVSASFLEAGGRSLTPVKVKFGKAEGQPASPVLEARRPSEVAPPEESPAAARESEDDWIAKAPAEAPTPAEIETPPAAAPPKKAEDDWIAKAPAEAVAPDEIEPPTAAVPEPQPTPSAESVQTSAASEVDSPQPVAPEPSSAVDTPPVAEPVPAAIAEAESDLPTEAEPQEAELMPTEEPAEPQPTTRAETEPAAPTPTPEPTVEPEAPMVAQPPVIATAEEPREEPATKPIPEPVVAEVEPEIETGAEVASLPQDEPETDLAAAEPVAELAPETAEPAATTPTPAPEQPVTETVVETAVAAPETPATTPVPAPEPVPAPTAEEVVETAIEAQETQAEIPTPEQATPPPTLPTPQAQPQAVEPSEVPAETPSAPAPAPTLAEAPATAVAALPPPTDPGAQIGSHRDGTCQDCESAEWTLQVSVAAPAAAASGSSSCGPDVLAVAQAAMQGLSTSIQLELDGFIGPLGNGSAQDALRRVEPDLAAPFEGALAPYIGGSSPCQIVGLVLPKAVRFSRLRIGAMDQENGGACAPGQTCPIGDAVWLGSARVERGPSATIVYGLFENRSTERGRRAILMAYYRPPNANWKPRLPAAN